jgi:predicted Ser/Thr protein kinase
VIPGYEILGEIGRGGMGVVYKARQLALNRFIALKMILAGEHSAPQEVIRFLAEAEAVAQLQHPHIVQVFEIGQHEGRPYFTMEYIAGSNLERQLAGTPMPDRPAAELVARLAEAVQAAHERGIVHRDLKPANVLLTPDGTPKITDFGLAKRVEGGSGLTQSGAIVGTPSYMAPEQAGGQGKAVGPAADVYALGAILYECLTGRPPFKAATPLDTVLQVISDEPVPPRRLQPKLARDLETVCLKCLAKEPHGRYASARELAEDLGRFLRGEPVRARPVGALGRLVHWARRRPAVAALLLALLLLSVLGGGGLVHLRLEAARARAAEAEARAERAQERERLAQRSLEQVEDTLAENLLLPMGYDQQELTAADLRALRKLAEQPSERVRLRFMEMALADPESAARLGRRCDVRAHAAVGLDPGRRERVVAILHEALKRPDSSWRIQETCIHLGVALDTPDKPFCGEGVRAGLELMAAVTEPARRAALATAVANLADWLGPQEAARASGVACKILVKTMRKTEDPAALQDLAAAVAALAARLEPGEAAQVARSALQPALNGIPRLTKSGEADTLKDLVEAVDALLARLPPEEAAKAAGACVVGYVTAVTSSGSRGWGFVEYGMRPLVARLGPDEAAAVVLHIINVQAGPRRPGSGGFIGLPVRSLADRLRPGEAAAAARKALDALVLSDDPELLGAVKALVARLEPEEAAKSCAAAARKLLASLTASRDSRSRSAEIFSAFAVPRAAGMRILAPRLAPEEAAALANQALQAMPRAADDPGTLAALAQGVAALAARLPPQEAATVSEAAARKLLDALTRNPDDRRVVILADGLSALAGRVGSEVAGAAAAALLDAADRRTQVRDVFSYAKAVEALAARLGTPEAARLSAAAARNVFVTQAKAPANPVNVISLVSPLDPSGLETLSGRLEPHEAAAIARQLLDAMTQLPEGSGVANFAYSVAVLAGRLAPQEAAEISGAAARRLLDAVTTRRVASQFRHLDPKGMEALAIRLGPEEAGAVAHQAVEAMAKVTDPRILAALAQAVNILAPRLGPREAPGLAQVVAPKLFAALGSTSDPTVLRELVATAAVPAAQLGPEEATSAARKVLEAVARTTASRFSAFRTASVGTLRVLMSRLTVAEQVELLKEPTCVGEAREVVLGELGRRLGPPAPEAAALAGATLTPAEPRPLNAVVSLLLLRDRHPTGRRPFADVWEAADWLRTHNPEIDLAAPLRRASP